MNWKSKKTMAIGAAVIATIGGGVGGALAAGGSSGGSEGQAFLSDAAQRLGVTPEALESALKAAAADRVDAAVAAGRLTQEQANRLKQRIQSAEPGGLFRVGHRHGRRGIFKAAADYLGLTPTQLFQQLRAGNSLADVAKAQGKTVDGLEQAILAAAKTRLDQAVANNRITAAQEQNALDRLKGRLDTLVNRKLGHPSP